jgi:cob(I)alamin adenosyltransferase
MKIYTKRGDSGTTSLIGGERVSKADVRVEAYGTVDELSAQLAMLSDLMRPEGALAEMVAALEQIQRELMTVEALLATGQGGEGKVAPLPQSASTRLEAEIDAMSEGLPTVKGFTLAGGHPVVSQSNVCRTVCRRAERAIVRAAEKHPVPEEVQSYINRLSDWLYTATRKAGATLGVEEIYWTP